MCFVVFVLGQTPGSYGSGGSRHAAWHCSWLPHCDLWLSPQTILLLLHHQTLHQKVCPTVNISNGNDHCCCVENVCDRFASPAKNPVCMATKLSSNNKMFTTFALLPSAIPFIICLDRLVRDQNLWPTHFGTLTKYINTKPNEDATYSAKTKQHWTPTPSNQPEITK